MITFKNIAGNKFLAVGTIQRKSALNGEKSLTGTLYDGKDVLNKIDKGWSLEFDGEPYVVTYFERNDNDNSVSFDAIHKFFWDMTKSVLYSETSGSHTIKWYLDQIFADTGYSYALNFNPNAIQKENWGMKNKLSLFNDIISSIEGEFEINGTLISIFKNIGTDLSTIVRYGFNLSDMTLENDATSFVTYGEGFGEYADPENMTGDRLHVTYTSPLASVYGKLQAEPIDNRNYTIAENLLAAIKKQVDDSFSVSVNLSLYDLSVAGYPYKMANVGDWLTAVDENLDFKQRIRIISIDDDFAADGTRISYAVTAGNVGVTKRYQDANASLASKVEEAVVSSGQAITDANIALIAANGKNKSYYLNNVDDLPQTANEGDLAWVQSGDGRVLYIYTKKSDGSYYWEKRIDPEMGEQIEAGVNDAITTSKENTDKAIADNNTQINETINQVAKEQADLAIKDGDFNNKAQAMADKALQDAKDNTATVAQETLNSANQNIAAAKSDLTDGLQKEVSDRTSAVTALDTKAQDYANTAKTDALNTIAKEVTNRQNAVSALDTKATNAVNQAKSDITDTINAINVGGRNYILNSKRTLSSQVDANDTGWVDTSVPISMFSNRVFTISVQVDYDNVTNVKGFSRAGIQLTAHEVKPDGSNVTRYFEAWSNAKVGESFHGRVSTTFDMRGLTLSSVYTPNHWGQGMYISGITATNVYVSNPKIEIGNKATDYTQAPEDVVLDYTTKDNQIKETITQYKDTNDGKVSQAQTDATTALGLVSTKVSQTDYDQKTGDLTTKYTEVKQTADSQATDIVDIKKTASSQASKINSISSDVDGTKQSISDIESTQDSQSDKINQITTDVDGTKQSITDIQTKDGKQDTRMGTIETSVSGVKSDFSSYKATNDGVVKTAQTTAQTAVDGLKTKVSQTDYNAKTGQLQTDLTSTTQTANQAKTDIVSINQKDSSQDSRMNTIESDASGTKQTISDIQKKDGQQDSNIASIVSDVSGLNAKWSQTQSDINNLGQINQLFNTEFNPDFSGWELNEKLGTVSVKKDITYDGSTVVEMATTKGQGVANSGSAWLKSPEIPVQKGVPLSFGVCARVISKPTDSTTRFYLAQLRFTYSDGNYSYSNSIIDFYANDNVPSDFVRDTLENVTIPDNVVSVCFYSWIRGEGTVVQVSKPMGVFEKNIGTYVQGNYSNNDKVASLSVGIDGLNTSFTEYKGTNDAKVSKAQSDLTANANLISQKVSQSDYDNKTGDLTTKVSKAQQTADTAVTTIGYYKTSNDNRISAAETKISQNADAINLRATKTDLDSAKSDYTAKISQVNINVDGVKTSVSNLQSQVNDLGQVNQLFNTEFNPDFESWNERDPKYNLAKDITSYNGSNVVSVVSDNDGYDFLGQTIPVVPNQVVSFSSAMKFKPTNPDGSTVYWRFQIQYLDSDNKTIKYDYGTQNFNQLDWTVQKLQNKTVPDNAAYVAIRYYLRGVGRAWFSQPMLVLGTSVGKYVQGNYNNNGKISAQQVTIDGITNTVSNQGTDINKLTSRVQTAEGTLSTATDNISGMQTKLTTTANQISQEISDRKTGDSNTLQSSKDFTQSTITGYDSGLQSQLTQTNDAFLATVSANNLVVDSSLMDSAFSNSIVNWNVTRGNGWYYSSSVAYKGVQSMGYNQTGLDGAYSYVDTQPWSNYSFAGTKLNISVDVRANTMGGTDKDYLIVYLLELDKDGNTVVLTNVTGTIKTANSSWVNYRKSITVNSASKSFFLRYQMRGNGNVYISRPYVGVQELIAGGYTAGTNNNNQTILSLLKDNWSIGIADNIGTITSGIVGNNASMSLISKNVIIDSPSTQITGTAWINSAMIANGAIGSAQIGDASITSAKIIDLDVARLTGNTTQFIKSNWDSAYSNVSIDPDSILLNAKSGSTTLTSVSIGSLGMKIEMPGMASFLSDTMINSGGIAFHHAGGTYGSFGMLGNGFSTQYSPTGGAPLGITVGDGRNNDAANMAFGISVSQYAGQAPQLIWAGANTGKVSSSYRTWDNPAGFIIADNIKFSTWDNTASIVEFDSTITYRNWAPDQTYGYIDGNGTKRWFKVSGYTLNGTNKLVGIFGGDGQNGLAVDQTGDVFFSIKGNSYSVHTMLAKLNML